MSKWFAIKGPDGALIPFTLMDARRWSWWRLYTSTPAMQCDGSGESDAAIKKRGERLGYRCVEVNLVEVNATTTGGGGEKGK